MERTKSKSLDEHLGKLPPQAVEMEEAVLGALMLERDAMYAVSSILSPEDFYKDSHHEVYQAIINLSVSSKPVDIKTVTHELRRIGKLEIVGGAHYVAELTTKVNSAANAEYHARIIKEQSVKRNLIRISSEIQRDAYEDTIDIFKLLDQVDTDLFTINSSLGSSDVKPLSSSMGSIIEGITKAKEAKQSNQVVGVPSGIKELDRATGGFKNTDLIIIAARPGMGKTAMITTIIKNCGCDFDIPVGMLSMEMSTEQIGHRLVSSVSDIELSKIRDGGYKDYEFDQIIHKTRSLINDNIIIDDTPALTPLQIKSKARLMVKKYGIKLLMVDYLQLARDPSVKNREQEISRISGSLKATAKDLNIPVIALSQLSRAVEQRGGDKRPMLSDLRDSGSIEQDADMVMFLYRPEYYGINTDESGIPTYGLGEIIIAKYRNGNPSTVNSRFIGKFTKWVDLTGENQFSMQPISNEIFNQKDDTNIQTSDNEPF